MFGPTRPKKNSWLVESSHPESLVGRSKNRFLGCVDSCVCVEGGGWDSFLWQDKLGMKGRFHFSGVIVLCTPTTTSTSWVSQETLLAFEEQRVT